MKILLVSILALLSIQAQAQTQYATPVQEIICKDLDFDSYFKVQNIKSNLLRSNPERKHPNFAGKYLLLKNEYLFNTTWFVADCATGKFIKEAFTPDHKKPKGEFKADSALFIVSPTTKDDLTQVQYHVFQNEQWMRVDAPESASMPAINPTPAAISTSPGAGPGLPTAAASVSATSPQDLFLKYPVTIPPSSACKNLDFDSYHRAQDNKAKLIKQSSDLQHPNFAGHYLLLKVETITTPYWFIADCETGKFLPETLTGEINFQKDSSLIKRFSSGSYASYRQWLGDEQQWIQVPGTDKNNKETIQNTIQGKTAKTLFSLIPNPDRSTTLHFGNLQCGENHCEVDLGKRKAVPLQISEFKTATDFLKIWGADLKIKSGNCKNEDKSFRCDIEN